MKTLSLSTWLFSDLPLKEMVTHVVKCGYSNVELSGANWGNMVWDREEIAEECAKQGVKVLSAHCHHHAALDKNTDFKEFCAYHEAFYAKLRPFKNLIMVEHAPAPSSVMAGKFKDQVRFLAELCDKYGFVCTLENVPHGILIRPEDFEGLFSDKVKFTFDGAHAGYVNLDPLGFAKYFDHLVNMHVYDVHPSVEMGDWLPAGLGRMDWPSILKAAKNANYTGPLTVELCSEKTRAVMEIFRKTGAAVESAEGVADSFAICARELLQSMLASIGVID